MIDLIRDGVRPADRRARGNVAVWDALGKTALSAINRGWSEAEWTFEVLRPISRLGQQVRVTTQGKEVPRPTVDKQLAKAWTRAAARAEESPRWTTEAAARHATERAEALGRFTEDADALVDDAERLILRYAAQVAEETGSTSVNLPRRRVQDATGLGERTVRHRLERLARRGLLEVAARGRASADPAARRATSYRLPEPGALGAYLSRVPRQMGPMPLRHKTDGTQTETTLGTQAQTDGTPSPRTTEGNESPMTGAAQPPTGAATTITLSGTPEQVRHALDVLASAGLPVDSTPRHVDLGSQDGKVTPIRRRAR